MQIQNLKLFVTQLEQPSVEIPASKYRHLLNLDSVLKRCRECRKKPQMTCNQLIPLVHAPQGGWFPGGFALARLRPPQPLQGVWQPPGSIGRPSESSKKQNRKPGILTSQYHIVILGKTSDSIAGSLAHLHRPAARRGYYTVHSQVHNKLAIVIHHVSYAERSHATAGAVCGHYEDVLARGSVKERVRLG